MVITMKIVGITTLEMVGKINSELCHETKLCEFMLPLRPYASAYRAYGRTSFHHPSHLSANQQNHMAPFSYIYAKEEIMFFVCWWI